MFERSRREKIRDRYRIQDSSDLMIRLHGDGNAKLYDGAGGQRRARLSIVQIKKAEAAQRMTGKLTLRYEVLVPYLSQRLA